MRTPPAKKNVLALSIKHGAKTHAHRQFYSTGGTGKVVSRGEIREKLWPADTLVDFDHSLGTTINKIRAALRDSAEEPQFIETLPKRGYRFIGKIETSIDLRPSNP